jgi:hypothetical protein
MDLCRRSFRTATFGAYRQRRQIFVLFICLWISSYSEADIIMAAYAYWIEAK